MSKSTSKPEKKELPEPYPRTEKILIFSDMGELDHVVEVIEDLGGALCSLITPESPVEKWLDLVNNSPVYGMMGYLREACIEYERFSQFDGWNPKEDQDFMECMNDSHELHYLVNELEEGRLIEINGRPCIHYDPAYHAAARSLEIAMYFREMPGGKDWIDYCIRELKFYLTRYHAASLEIVMHRSNVYLINNARNIKAGADIREAVQARVDEQKKEADELARKIVAKVKELYVGNRSITQARKMAAEDKDIKVSLSTVMRASRRLK